MRVSYETIFVMGPQGSGKGTQAKILAEKLGFFYWGMGEILRSMGEHRFGDGTTVAGIIDQGLILPDDKLTSILAAKLPEVPRGKGIIFDGVPRRLGQAKFLIGWLKEEGRTNPATLFISLSHEESVRRLTLRAKLESRTDDAPEVIAERLREYQEVTKPMLAYMKENTTFFEIDGMPPVSEVAAAIVKALEIHD